MTIYIGFVIYVLAFLGAIHISSDLYNYIMHKNIENTYIVINIDNEDASIECVIRNLMRENPNSEIIVIDNNIKNEEYEILKRLCNDYPFIHTAQEFDFFK